MPNRFLDKLNRFFRLEERGTTVRTEVLAGVTSFITVAYILILNPQILSHPYEIMGDMDMAGRISNGVFIGTCIASFIGTILCALYAKVPFVQAPGMGLNAFFAYTVVLAMGYTYSQSLVVVFISGVLFIVITKVGLREAIIRAIPDSVINAVTPGVGLFITIIGLKNSGLVVGNDATLVSLVDFSQWRTPGADISGLCSALVALVGLIAIGVLHIKKVRGSIFLGIIVATIVGIPLGVTSLDGLSFDMGGKFTDFFQVSFLQMDFAGMMKGESLADSLFACSCWSSVSLLSICLTASAPSWAPQDRAACEGGRRDSAYEGSSYVRCYLYRGRRYARHFHRDYGGGIQRRYCCRRPHGSYESYDCSAVPCISHSRACCGHHPQRRYGSRADLRGYSDAQQCEGCGSQ